MAIRKLDLGKLTMLDYVIGVILAVVGTAVVTAMEMVTNIALPSVVASVAGAAIGIAAWFTYLLKRKADHAR